MKITRLETFVVPPRWLFLKIETDEGIVGWGEPVVEGRAHTVEAAVQELADYLVYKPESKARPWRLLRVEGGYRVTGTPPSEEELGRALKAAGAKKGASVEVGDEEFELA